MSDASLSLHAYAKVNLHLDVIGRTPDGYHKLVTLFERLDLCDEISVRLTPGGRIRFQCEDPEIPADPTNLVVRAAEGYCRALGRPLGIEIRLIKKIPVGGGLGGGSSDAAATLTALQTLTDRALPDEAVWRLAKGLGADVPFFLTDSPWALGYGRGDELEPLQIKRQFWHLLVTPDFSIPTKEIYQAFSLTAPGPDVRLLLCALEEKDASQVGDLLFNVLEPTVEELYPAIRHVKAAMKTQSELKCPLVSGSGSTVMALCSDRAQAEAAYARLASKFPAWRVFVSQTH